MKSYQLLFILLAFCACQPPISETDNSTIAQGAPIKEKRLSSLLFLMNFKGQYPFDCQLLDNQVTGQRLKQMFGDRYDFVKSIWNVESPIEIQDSLFYAIAIQEQSKADPSAVIMANIAKDQLFAGIRENGKVKLYFENDSNFPDRLRQWARANQSLD